jgi:hypothetical protein
MSVSTCGSEPGGRLAEELVMGRIVLVLVAPKLFIKPGRNPSELSEVEVNSGTNWGARIDKMSAKR